LHSCFAGIKQKEERINPKPVHAGKIEKARVFLPQRRKATKENKESLAHFLP
jgi:hypothetical protein